MTLMDSSLNASHRSLILLAPSSGDVPRRFRAVEESASRHEAFLAEMQKLRGEVYLSDGAIESWEVDDDGRHRLDIDADCWHLLSRDSSGAVRGCARLRVHASTATFTDLWVRNAAVAGLQRWCNHVRSAVESEMDLARRRAVSYVEVGGWAIASERRCTLEAVRIALATFGLAQALGGCLGITTATVRHCSSSILRRLGGAPLTHDGVGVPPYYDPQFRCDMEMLRFDSTRPNPRYRQWVERMRGSLLNVPVVCNVRRPCRDLTPVRVASQAPATMAPWAVLQPA